MELISNLSCRICFKNTIARAANVLDVAYLFLEITGYEIHANDVPQKICTQCLDKLILIRAFRKTCEKSEKFLKDFRKLKTEKILLQEPKVEIPEVSPVPLVAEEQNPPKKNDKEKIICTLCGEYVQRRYMKMHTRKNHENIRFECHFCGKVYREKRTLVVHMQENHVTNKTKYPCKVCGKLFNTHHARYSHGRFHHAADTRPFECDVCKKRFITAFILKHHKSTHSESPSFPCPHCDVMFFHELRLKNHLRLQHSDSTVKCPTCGKEFRNTKHWRQHNLVHLPNKYFCPVCPTTFSQNCSLRTHVTKQHPDYELPPKGTICRNVRDINELKEKQ